MVIFAEGIAGDFALLVSPKRKRGSGPDFVDLSPKRKRGTIFDVGRIIHGDHDDTAHSREDTGRVAMSLGVAVHVGHLARKALFEPGLQMIEAVGGHGGSDAGQREAFQVSPFLDSGRQLGCHEKSPRNNLHC